MDHVKVSEFLGYETKKTKTDGMHQYVPVLAKFSKSQVQNDAATKYNCKP